MRRPALLTLFVLLGLLKVKAWIAGLVSLGVALLVAIVFYGRPVDQALLSGTEGAAFGFFPIMWIVLNAIWVYNLTVTTGHFDVLRRSFEKVSPDLRVQAIFIAFCFGACSRRWPVSAPRWPSPWSCSWRWASSRSRPPPSPSSPTPRQSPSGRWPPRWSPWPRSPRASTTTPG